MAFLHPVTLARLPPRPRAAACAPTRMVADVKGSSSNPYRIAVLAGDGAGPRVAAATRTVLDALASSTDLHFECVDAPYGAHAFESSGVLVPPQTVEVCRSADAVLRSYQGMARGDGRDGSAHFQLRDALGLFAQIRPVVVYPPVMRASPLRSDVVEGVDLLLVREISGGALGVQALDESGEDQTSTVSYGRAEIERVADVAWEFAEARSGRLLNVDKADAMRVSRFWRRVVQQKFDQLARANEGVRATHMYVDDFMRELILRPAEFDVVLTSNLFGDIVAEVMSALAGPQRTTPSAWVGPSGVGVYGPADIYNSSAYPSSDSHISPLALIRAASMMLRYAFDEPAAADLIQQALRKTMADVATPGLPASNGVPLPVVEPEEYAELVVRALELNRQYEQMCAPQECGE